MLKGKTVLLGVTGSIAAYKAASLASLLVKAGADVHVLMTQNAAQFIHPVTFETLTAHRCITDTFDRETGLHVPHVDLAKQADLYLIAPASANVIGKLANGIADDMVTTTALAVKAPLLVAPAMNTAMYESAAVQENLQRLAARGTRIIDPAYGYLACGDTGAGKMPEPAALFEEILFEIAKEKDLAGKRILVTAGPTQEAIDPVRYITNHSSGKMGYALARAAMLRGAEVTLVSGPVALEAPPHVTLVPVTSAADMAEAVKSRFAAQDIVIKAAAVADYRPAAVAEEKIKKTEGAAKIDLERTEDILSWLGANKKPGQVVCGFSMETEHLLENSRAKLAKKKADMIVANSLRAAGAGFGTDTNIVTLITAQIQKELPLMSKDDVADAILDALRDAGEGEQG